MGRKPGLTDRKKKHKKHAAGGGKKGALKDSRKAAGAKSAELRARELTPFGSRLDGELSALKETIGDLPGSWAVVHADVTPNGNGDVFCAAYASTAEVLPADLQRAGLEGMHMTIPVYDVRLSPSHLKLYVMGKAVPAGTMQALVNAAATSIGETADSWDGLLEHGLSIALCAILLTMLQDFPVCGGIVVDDKVNELLQYKDKSIYHNAGEFVNKSGGVIAREESFPPLEAEAATDAKYSSCRVIRHVDCQRLVQTEEEDLHICCEVCKQWGDSSLSRGARMSEKQRDYDPKAAEAAAASQQSRLPLSTLAATAPELLLQRSRNMRDELNRAKTRLRIELEKRATEKVRLADGGSVLMDEVLLLAEQALVGGALDDDPEAKQLFEESSLFQETWRSQVRGLKTKLKEAEKLKSKGMGGKAKGTGMRYHPTVKRWALRLYNKSRGAYREAQAAMPFMPCERCDK